MVFKDGAQTMKRFFLFKGKITYDVIDGVKLRTDYRLKRKCLFKGLTTSQCFAI